MKKIIGIIGVAVLAMTMFFSTNSVDNETGLVNLIAINTANAYQTESDSNGCDTDEHDRCMIYGHVVTDCDPSWAWHTC